MWLPSPLLFPGLATCGERDPAHAVSPMAAAATRTASPAVRRYVLVISLQLRSGEKFLSGKVYVPYGCFHCAGVTSGRNERDTGTVITGSDRSSSVTSSALGAPADYVRPATVHSRCGTDMVTGWVANRLRPEQVRCSAQYHAGQRVPAQHGTLRGRRRGRPHVVAS